MAHSTAPQEETLALVFLRREVRKRLTHRSDLRQAFVVFRPAGNQRTDELRQRPGDALARDSRVAERLAEQFSVSRVLAEERSQRRQVLAHFDSALDGPEDLFLQRGSPFVP